MVNLVSEFSMKEENELIQYIVKNNKYQYLHQEEFWKEIKNLNITKKTWQSLKEHFEKSIIYRLKNPSFKLKKEEIDSILKAFPGTSETISMENTDCRNTQSKEITEADEDNPKKIIVITRKKNSKNVYPNYRTEGRKRILVSRHNEPSPNTSYYQPNLANPNKTIIASLCTGKKKEIFVVRPKDEEPFERYGTATNKKPENKPPKKLICFSYNVT